MLKGKAGAGGVVVAGIVGVGMLLGPSTGRGSLMGGAVGLRDTSAYGHA